MNQHATTYGLNDGLTIDDLRAYRAGQLSGAALHRVERILLEDPFYTDALDGLDALQQVGANLHLHTRDLHLALQERVGETATPRRLMPLWVTSAAASIVLVICVAIYHFFYVRPTVGSASAGAIEPGPVLIDTKTLGIDESERTSVAAKPTYVSNQQAITKSGKHTTKSVRHRQVATNQPILMPVIETSVSRKSSCAASVLSEDRDILPLPISQADLQRRQMVDTERAFER